MTGGHRLEHHMWLPSAVIVSGSTLPLVWNSACSFYNAVAPVHGTIKLRLHVEGLALSKKAKQHLWPIFGLYDKNKVMGTLNFWW